MPTAWLTEERLRLYPRALFLGLVAAFALALLTADGARTASGRLGGDFAAFYAAGSLIAEGQAALLYDWSTQAAAQTNLHPDDPEGFLAFAYPPFVAVAYAPLSRLPFALGYALHTLAMGLALYGAVATLGPVLPRIGRWPFVSFVALLTFYPMFRAVLGAQNTALSVLLVAVVWRGLHDRRDARVGLAAGLLLYKPQFGLPLLGLLALHRPRALLWALLPAAGLYLTGALVAGIDWIPWWWSQIGTFHAMDQAINAPNSVGILGFLEACLGPGTPVALGLGGLFTAALIFALMWAWYLPRHPLAIRMGLTSCGLVLVPPHSMFYDGGLAALGLLVLADARGIQSAPQVAGLHLAGALALLSGALGANPLLLVVVAIAVALMRLPAPHGWRPPATGASLPPPAGRGSPGAP